MLHRFIFLLAILVPAGAIAQSRAFECFPDKAMTRAAGEETLRKTQEAYESVRSLEARFEQDSFLASLDVAERSEGTMIFEKPGRMRWNYERPEEQVFLLNDSTMYLYQPADRQVVIDEFNKIVLTELPVAFLMGIGDLSDNFKLLSACRSADGIVLVLTPKKNRGELKELRLLISPSNYRTLGGKVLDDSGNVTAVVFRDLTANQPLAARSFEPNFPKGIDVTDRRKNDE